MPTKITIIGGGISGITTALTLRLLGYETTIYAEYLVDDEAPDDPRFASLYPAASVIPHSIQTDNIDRLLPPSQQIFQLLLENEVSGMQLHKHYELFEEKVDNPPYARFLKNYSRIDDLDIQSIPHRTKAAELSGWMFDCLITEWPTYIENLYAWYKKTGGRIIRKRMQPEDIAGLDSEVVVNCCGIWSPQLFEDAEPQRVIKGHLLYIKDAPLIRDPSGNIPSYNYTPGKKLYADPQGNATDVYFYPRSNGWILGGSRQRGVVDEQGAWCGRENRDNLTINGTQIPRQILELNTSIIDNTFGISLSQFSNVEAKAGYRYVRNYREQGLRLDKIKEYGKTIIHNYGHGGAGVTLSWGCALQAVQLIKKQTTGNDSLSDLQAALLTII